MKYDYPGNVRKLYKLLERASMLNQMVFDELISEHKQMLKNLVPIPKLKSRMNWMR